MEISNIETFLAYYARIRERTLNVIRVIPPDRINWTWQEGKFSIGDLIRHIGAVERFMYAETIQDKPSRYTGCGRELADGYHDVLAFLHQTHQESLEIFRRLGPEDLQHKCVTPAGSTMTVWKWLRAMVEHEIHHRGQLYVYLSLLELTAPPIFGLTSEQLRDLNQVNSGKGLC